VLDIKKKSEYARFFGLGNKDFDALYTYTIGIYESLASMQIDESVPVDQIFLFYHQIEQNQKDIADIEKRKQVALQEEKKPKDNLILDLLGNLTEMKSIER
jgi:hypothetical protein